MKLPPGDKNTNQKLARFLVRVDTLIENYYREGRGLIAGPVNQFYYMQKKEELKMLNEQVDEALKRLDFYKQRFDDEYKEVFLRWRKDVREIISKSQTVESNSKV